MIKQGEIHLVDLNPTIGSEISKTRPCLVVSADDIGILPLKVVAPITEYKPHYEEVPWMVNLKPNSTNKLLKLSVVDAFQLRSISNERIVKRIGVLTRVEFLQVIEAIKIVLGIY